MTTKTAAVVAALALALAGACSTTKETRPMSTTTTATQPAKRTGHAELDGVRYYYEVRGEGPPVLVLHGGLGSVEMMEPLFPILGKDRQIIAVDLHGHGRTSLGKRTEMSLVDQGNDMAALLAQLGVAQADVVGFSLGGGVAFRLARQHPTRVKRLVLISAGFARDGFYPDMLPQQDAVNAQLADMMKDTPMYRTYAAIAPDKAEFGKLLDAIGVLMRKPYNYADDVKQLAVPTLLIFGDADMYRPEHVIEFYKLLGGGQGDPGWQRERMPKHQLAILPDLTHYEMTESPVVAATARRFLDGAARVAASAH